MDFRKTEHVVFNSKCDSVMKFLRWTALVAVMILFCTCGRETGIFSDRAYRRQVLQDLEQRREMLARCDALRILDEASLTEREREALQFLYAYMPLGDAVNFDGDYFLRNVRLSEAARERMPWGAIIPVDYYRHFVLPVRVNNEDLDEARGVFYAELSERVQGLSMQEAILEINHWCHEKAVYTPTDSRTSAPLAMICTAAGRCGEESTLLVAALRAVGIPARQVYTPRWAHTDDNHAWVEAWADGEWYFLGACEPEPVLDLGWFNAPASRGMLLHTNVFGRYEGPEQVMRRTPLFTEINITENYAPTASVAVSVIEADGTPAADARVEYKIYNYSELYSIASQQADAQGRTSVIAGRGDALVWASKEGRYGFAKVSFGKDEAVTVTLDKTPGATFASEFCLVPPPESGELPPVTEEQRAENTRRMIYEDSLRNAYTATFRTTAQGEAFARKLGLDATRTAALLVESKGNYAAIEAFLEAAVGAGKGDRALALLEQVSRKDLHDTPREVFDDHLYQAEGDPARIMNPRVGLELLSAYRAYLQEQIPAADAARFREDPQQLVAWCRDSLRMESMHNMRLVPIRPIGVWESRIVDRTSRDLFFIAVCRSLEIPAWRDEVTGKIRYSHAGTDYDVDFEAPEPAPTDYGTLKLTHTPSVAVPDPYYYKHFTLSRIEEGRMRLLHFGEGNTWNGQFREGVRLEAGDYALVSGTRLSGGEVLTELRIFTIAKEAETTVDLVLPAEQRSGEVYGTFDTELEFQTLDGQTRALHASMGDGCCVVGILGAGEEPTNHALNDIAAFREALETAGTPIILLFASEENARRFVADDFPAMPSTLQFGIDATGELRTRLVAGAGLTRDELPIVAVTDGFGRILFRSSGYSIGLGERLVKELAAQ